jgi:Lar family restriction alleviation protein
MIEACPFCGEQNVAPGSFGDRAEGLRHFYCGTCGAQGPTGIDEETARKRWNRRTDRRLPAMRDALNRVVALKGMGILPAGAGHLVRSAVQAAERALGSDEVR